MVLQRRLDYGFNGYQAPVVPRASRSARGRGQFKKKCEDNRIQAFEILASIAGNLLQEGESSGLSNSACGNDQFDVKDTVKLEPNDVGQLLKAEASEKETSNKKTVANTPDSKGYHPSYSLNPPSSSQETCSLKGNIASNHSEKINVAEKLTSVSSKTSTGSPSSKVGGESSCGWKLLEGQPADAIEIKPESDLLNTRSTDNISHTFNESLGDAMEVDVDARPHSCSESNIKTSLFKDCVAPGSFPGHCNNIKVTRRDDDENSFRGSQLGAVGKSHKSVPFAGDRRVRAASRDWKYAQNLKSGDHFRNDRKMKPVYNNRGSYFSHYGSQKMFPFKKRKFFDLSPLSTSDREFLSEEINNSSDEQANYDDFGTVTGAASSAAQQARTDARECNVKLSIKSFKVPELFIEIPATATVASLKRTVMEAVNTILGDGLHVGILLQGKKVRDDSKTLLQTGISEDDKHGSLGFILEPNHSRITSASCTHHHIGLGNNRPGELTRHTASLMMQPGASNGSPISKELSFGTRLGSDLAVAPSCADTSTVNTTTSDSRAMVAMPSIGMEALAVVPYNRKPGHPEFGQRRMRRPFSVSEVEALVQAVEKLGTGRWRDVKLRAFDYANHRTYVDLKDKWKTLVHTARISPQQRRGEPVPQQLLDRVLAAHAYWSQHQARQQVKSVV